MTDIKTCVPPLRLSSDIQSQINENFLWLETSIQALLPDATIEHVGSSAIPGALTKGDVDVMVQVEAAQFASARSALDSRFSYNPEMPPEDEFVSYSGEYQGMDFGIQLVSGNDDQFGFLRWREALRADHELLAKYNRIKQSRADSDMEAYRAAKSALILSFLEENA